MESDDLKDFSLDRNGWLTKKERLCVPNVGSIGKGVLEECHCLKFSIHPGGIKMYQDMKRSFFWKGMKRDAGLWVKQCLNCQKVYQKPSGLLQPLDIPIWK